MDVGDVEHGIEIREIGDDALAAAFPVVHQLRSHLTPETFRARVIRQRAHGYALHGAYAADGRLLGVIGARPVATLARGEHLHVDDLVVDAPGRGAGIGALLLGFAERRARDAGLAAIFLDSRAEVVGFYAALGYQPHTATLMRKRLDGSPP